MDKNAKKKTRRGRHEYEDLGDVELPPELDAEITRRINEAEEHLTATSVNFRWHKGQLDTVKKVAEMMGVPYQTYIKMVVYKQALVDFNAMTGPGPAPTDIVRSLPPKS